MFYLYCVENSNDDSSTDAHLSHSKTSRGSGRDHELQYSRDPVHLPLHFSFGHFLKKRLPTVEKVCVSIVLFCILNIFTICAYLQIKYRFEYVYKFIFYHTCARSVRDAGSKPCAADNFPSRWRSGWISQCLGRRRPPVPPPGGNNDKIR